MFVGLTAILAVMLRFRPQFKALLILLCIGIVMMRVGGAHLHYCFDGNEPPVSLHTDGHAGGHHLGVGNSSAGHEDVDVNVAVDILVKKISTLLDLLGLVAALAFVLHFLPRVRPVHLFDDSLLPVSAHRAYLRPPLRGPPL
jgi:hypothetical protein